MRKAPLILGGMACTMLIPAGIGSVGMMAALIKGQALGNISGEVKLYCLMNLGLLVLAGLAHVNNRVTDLLNNQARIERKIDDLRKVI